ncbi:hypothetical protein TVAG_008050 [Trichomonas vaginalis G3]|uniref:Uncharacterized protein n=1 Tax=Trichomonas vaginalis (strain ATCC PRA-98 / G3) TaxID=412133 RepID=A2EX20_TRIV3|nr:hypothetical protein TVAGG3_0442480 [Trichomonas vaginalis G3]EAY02797.1 hypothetical protein TVAG_008050 [Trichomonas vaginalis G3]KAI5537564.1 hypothetical protein TVAGG3_0442480 [Trichomonas vaginalis G3]|eukprot:XP_001315020.1 hypothetical protein [Trichomonas vaginalis G3]
MSKGSNTSLLETLKLKMNSLGPVDARSLQKILNTFTNFGDDFRRYRKNQLSGVPNTVIVAICKVLNSVGYKICVSRETERYNDIADLCIQQHWNNCLSEIFPHIHYVKPNTIILNRKYEFDPLRTLYTSAMQNYIGGTPFKSIEEMICTNESNTVSFIAHMKMEEFSFIATFQKVGTVHSLLSYVTYRKGNIFIFDSRLKKIKKKLLQDGTNFDLSTKTVGNIQELIDAVSEKPTFEKTFSREIKSAKVINPPLPPPQQPLLFRDNPPPFFQKHTAIDIIPPLILPIVKEARKESPFIFPTIPSLKS